MATLYISEYKSLARTPDSKNDIAAAQEPSVTTQVVNITGGSIQSAAFNAETRFIEVQPDAICSVAFGLNPTAAPTSKRMVSGQTQFFGVIPGHKVAVISNT